MKAARCCHGIRVNVFWNSESCTTKYKPHVLTRNCEFPCDDCTLGARTHEVVSGGNEHSVCRSAVPANTSGSRGRRYLDSGDAVCLRLLTQSFMVVRNCRVYRSTADDSRRFAVCLSGADSERPRFSGIRLYLDSTSRPITD